MRYPKPLEKTFGKNITPEDDIKDETYDFEAMILEQTGMNIQQYTEATIRYQSGQRVVQSRVWGAIAIEDPEVAKYYEEHIKRKKHCIYYFKGII